MFYLYCAVDWINPLLKYSKKYKVPSAGLLLLSWGDMKAHQGFPHGEVTDFLSFLPTPTEKWDDVRVTDNNTSYFSLCSCPSLAFNSSIFIAPKSRFIFSVYLVDLPVSIPPKFHKEKRLDQI